MSKQREPLLSGPDPVNQSAQLAELSLRLQDEIGKRGRAEKISRTIFDTDIFKKGDSFKLGQGMIGRHSQIHYEAYSQESLGANHSGNFG